jgi:hypothetical protein
VPAASATRLHQQQGQNQSYHASSSPAAAATAASFNLQQVNAPWKLPAACALIDRDTTTAPSAPVSVHAAAGRPRGNRHQRQLSSDQQISSGSAQPAVADHGYKYIVQVNCCWEEAIMITTVLTSNKHSSCNSYHVINVFTHLSVIQEYCSGMLM